LFTIKAIRCPAGRQSPVTLAVRRVIALYLSGRANFLSVAALLVSAAQSPVEPQDG